jgi:hypothetical protein
MILQKYIDRFWKKVDKTSNSNGCWIFGNGKGYQMFGPEYNAMYAHRFSYTIHKGKIPYGLFVCHTCDNPGCVNPEHLWLGTNKDNTDDKVAKGRQLKGSQIPSARFTEAQIYEIRSATYYYGLNRDLAKKYNCRQEVISKLRSGQGWKHVKI